MPQYDGFDLKGFLENWDCSSSRAHHVNLLKRRFDSADRNGKGGRVWNQVEKALAGGQPRRSGPSPFDDWSAGEIIKKTGELDARIRKLGARLEFLREKVLAYDALFRRPDVPDDLADGAFGDCAVCVSVILSIEENDRDICAAFLETAFNFAGYYHDRMKEHNNEAEKKARLIGVCCDRYEDCRGEVEAGLRRAVECGHRAIAIVAEIAVPVAVTEKLYSGFEESLAESYEIDESALLELSADGLAASIRTDRRLELLKKILAELCRCYVRLGAYAKARQCENKIGEIPSGYRSRKPFTIASFEEHTWKSIIAGSAEVF